jgi:hypothetical protein
MPALCRKIALSFLREVLRLAAANPGWKCRRLTGTLPIGWYIGTPKSGWSGHFQLVAEASARQKHNSSQHPERDSGSPYR